MNRALMTTLLMISTATPAAYVGGANAGTARVSTAKVDDAKKKLSNEAIVDNVIERALNAHNVAVLDEYFAANLVDHDLPPGTPPGPAGSKMKIGAFLAAFPDIHFTFESKVSQGDTLAGRGYFTGTQTGPLMGMPPTGKRVKVRFMDQWRFANGQVVEYWGQPDIAGMMQQLGVSAPAAPATTDKADAGHNDAGKAFVQAFRSNDPEKVAALYADDAVYFPTDQLALRGRAQIRASFVGFFAAFTVKEMHTAEVEHRTVGEISVSWGKWAGTLQPKAGGAPFTFEGRFTDISRRLDGKWLYVVDHASFPVSGK
jgi:uncharacterized protein (TIGR02246 family)